MSYRQIRRKQQGLTAITTLLILGMVGFFVLLAFRLFPIYSNHYKIQSVVKSLEQEQNLFTKSKRDVLRIINKKININFAEGFKAEHLVFKQSKTGNKEIHITYEDRRAILGNLDVVAKFDDYVVVTSRGSVKVGL